MKIGFVLLIAEMRHLKRAPTYQEVRELALAAEQAGFDSLWLYDHLLYRPEGEPTIGIWECWTFLSALAEATQRVELGTLVLCNQFRNPALLAKMAHTIDEVSNGRLILGLGAGWNQPEFDAFGYPFDHRVDRFAEALQIIQPLLKKGTVDFEGQYYQARDCQITPRSPRPDGPPLMIGSFGPRMMALTAQYADMWNSAYYSQPETFQEPLQKMQTACQEVGRAIDSLETTATIAFSCPDLGDTSQFMPNSLTGSVTEIAEILKQYDEMGVAHLMCHCAPYGMPIIERLAQSISLYRQM